MSKALIPPNVIKPLNDELNLIYPLLALFRAHHILHVSRQRVKVIKTGPCTKIAEIDAKKKYIQNTEKKETT